MPSIISTVTFIGILIFFKSKPPTPPTYSKIRDTSELTNFKDDFKSLLKNYQNLLATASSTLCLSYAFVIPVVIDPIARLYGFSGGDIAIFGTVFNFGGVIGGILTSVLLTFYPYFKLFQIIAIVLTFLSKFSFFNTIACGLIYFAVLQ
jgi:hypothetical protein